MLLILVIASDGNLYNHFKQTWISMEKSAKNIKVLFLYANPGLKDYYEMKNDNDLYLKTHDGQYNGGVLNKIVMALRYSYEYLYEKYPFDYTIISNLSTIILPDRMTKHLPSLAKDTVGKTSPYYFGGRFWYYKNTNDIFANFAILTFSNEIHEYLVQNQKELINKKGVAPDVHLSKFILKNFPDYTLLTRNGMYSILGSLYHKEPNISQRELPEPDYFDLDKVIENDDIFWIRVNNSKNRNVDIEVHNTIKNIFFN